MATAAPARVDLTKKPLTSNQLWQRARQTFDKTTGKTPHSKWTAADYETYLNLHS